MDAQCLNGCQLAKKLVDLLMLIWNFAFNKILAVMLSKKVTVILERKMFFKTLQGIFIQGFVKYYFTF